jgi:hypothetical protein
MAFDESLLRIRILTRYGRALTRPPCGLLSTQNAKRGHRRICSKTYAKGRHNPALGFRGRALSVLGGSAGGLCHQTNKMNPFIDAQKTLPLARIPRASHSATFPLRLESEEARFSLLRKRPGLAITRSRLLFLGKRCC